MCLSLARQDETPIGKPGVVIVAAQTTKGNFIMSKPITGSLLELVTDFGCEDDLTDFANLMHRYNQSAALKASCEELLYILTNRKRLPRGYDTQGAFNRAQAALTLANGGG